MARPARHLARGLEAGRSSVASRPHGVCRIVPGQAALLSCGQHDPPDVLAPGSGSAPPPDHESYLMSYNPERRKPAVFADRSGNSAFARSAEQLECIAETDACHARQVVTPAREAPLLRRNRLLLLIAGLAFLVAIGILTN